MTSATCLQDVAANLSKDILSCEDGPGRGPGCRGLGLSHVDGVDVSPLERQSGPFVLNGSAEVLLPRRMTDVSETNHLKIPTCLLEKGPNSNKCTVFSY